MRSLHPMRFFSGRALVVCAIVLCIAGRLTAQGATGAAVQGTVVSASGTAVEDATVLITNVATGERWQTLTRADGRFFLQHLSIGGPYRFEVRAIGFAPAERAGVFLSLGQRVTSDFRLASAAFQLEEVTVRAEADRRLNAGRTGPALTVPESTIVRLRGFWRSWLDLDRRRSVGTPNPLRMAILWDLIGDTTQALSWLERAYSERNPGLILLRSGSAFESHRSHPRVTRILAEMKFPVR